MEKQEQRQDFGEEQLEVATGGGLLDSLLNPFQKKAAKAADEALPHPNNGTYKAPGWVQGPTGRVHVYPDSHQGNTGLKFNH
jgi:hypothetical protein